MKNYDELLEKIETFEKLAIYGNRRSFLQAIAQNTPEQIWEKAKSPNVGTSSEETIDAGELDGEPRKELWNAAKQNWELTTASNDELSKLPAGTLVRAYMNNEWKYFKNNGPQGWIETTKPGGSISYRSDVFKAQQRLTKSPYSFNDLEVDGKLGPITRAHLKSYKQQVGNPTMTDEQAIAILSTEPYNEGPPQIPASQEGPVVTVSPKVSVQEPPF